ncbi:hypothetical protein D9756_007633 [Leucocoprinus leucothites]|uniref:Uncharacterized protein n=1 Tax=Leucocoprinus leucothites TaxID=201217 RepID=A0A8H5D1I6_9AGAR|nr:hypothetical protein D9756_007633 [Leucoagaricus leucothites]
MPVILHASTLQPRLYHRPRRQLQRGMEIQDLLKTNSIRLLATYHENINNVLDLQVTLIRDILPSVVDEFDLNPDATEWATEWLNDTASIFRIARRNKFTRSFALESIRKGLVWRLQNLWPTNPSYVLPPTVRCLPEHVRDPFGRPVLVVEVPPVNESPDIVKPYIIQAFEQLRLHLKSLSGAQGLEEEPILQYIILLDLAKLSLQSLAITLHPVTGPFLTPYHIECRCYDLDYSRSRPAIPRHACWSFHNQLFMGPLWRILPESAISRIFFPTKADLLAAMTADALPKDYGGDLPFLTDLDDPLRPGRTRSNSSSESVVGGYSASSTSSQQPVLGCISSISPTSMLNPFYGYPAASTRGHPQLHHGRRRKRDLARTLIWLFWQRWRPHITIGVVLTAFTLVINLGARRGLLRAPRIFGWQASLSSALRS